MYLSTLSLGLNSENFPQDAESALVEMRACPAHRFVVVIFDLYVRHCFKTPVSCTLTHMHKHAHTDTSVVTGSQAGGGQWEPGNHLDPEQGPR